MAVKTLSIAPSPARVRLPKLANPPATILDYLCHRFPQVGHDVWSARITNGKVRSDDKVPVTLNSAYKHGATLFYFREVEAEVAIPFQEEIIFQNDHLLVADKPHFLPVVPAGQSVNECLLYRLQSRTGIAELAPLHRLDRETAGLVLFSKVKSERAHYARLFANGEITRKYLAMAPIAEGTAACADQEWLVENRIEAGDPWFRMKIVPGLANASTRIALKSIHNGVGTFELNPKTGKKHQLRVHMASLGFPILNDPFYPELQERVPDDFSSPLQLLASEIKFNDPITGEQLQFASKRQLAF